MEVFLIIRISKMFLYKTCRRKHPPTKWILKGKQVLFSRLDCQACLWLCQEGTMLQFWKLLKVFSDNLNRQLMRVIIFCIGECKKKKKKWKLNRDTTERICETTSGRRKTCSDVWILLTEMFWNVIEWLRGWNKQLSNMLLQRCQIISPQLKESAL